MLFFLFLSGNYNNKYFLNIYVRGSSWVECYSYLYVRHMYGFWVQTSYWTYFIYLCKILSIHHHIINSHRVHPSSNIRCLLVWSVSKLENVICYLVWCCYFGMSWAIWLSFPKLSSIQLLSSRVIWAITTRKSMLFYSVLYEILLSNNFIMLKKMILSKL